MYPLFILLVGVAIVLGGILALRLHAFLALTLAALAVAALTRPADRAEAAVRKEAVAFTVSGSQARLRPKQAQKISAGQRLVVVSIAESGPIVAGVLMVKQDSDGLYVDATPAVPSAEQLLAPAETERPEAGDALATDTQTVGERVGAAFGATCGKIGILIAMAAIIGKCLLDSGAADRIVRFALSLVGEKGAPVAFLSSGFLLGIPVFFDTVFYLMMPLGKAMRMRTGRNYLLYVLTIVAGATMAHSLVPPTPGPLLVAGELGVDLGLMILGGSIVGLVTATAGLAWALFSNARHEVPLRESADFSLKDLEQIAHRDVSDLPPLWLSLAPIVLPVILIAGNTLRKSLDLALSPAAARWAETLGNKNIALTIAAAVALATLVWIRRTSKQELAESMHAALSSGGVIILITAAGGAFGAVLQQTGVVKLIQQLPSGSPATVLTLAFLITTAVRTAQGSATVAMITAVGVLAGLADPETLGCHPLYLALAIGAGSKPVAWMNDSGFWVICKMSGMTEGEALRFVTPMSILMGVTGLALVILGATVWPMV